MESLQFYRTVGHKRFSALTRQERQAIMVKPQGPPLVEIVCYCLMPNHFHLLVKQNVDDGISKFMRLIGDSHSKYFNILHDRVGGLFQDKFKALRVEDNAQLLHLSRYIHLNPVVSSIAETPQDYDWSSYREYIGRRAGFCNKEIVLGQFRGKDAYRAFVEDFADYIKKVKKIEHLALEEIS